MTARLMITSLINCATPAMLSYPLVTLEPEAGMTQITSTMRPSAATPCSHTIRRISRICTTYGKHKGDNTAAFFLFIRITTR
jgi:hypothetical protein